jgi:hypothetical protein
MICLDLPIRALWGGYLSKTFSLPAAKTRTRLVFRNQTAHRRGRHPQRCDWLAIALRTSKPSQAGTGGCGVRTRSLPEDGGEGVAAILFSSSLTEGRQSAGENLDGAQVGRGKSNSCCHGDGQEAHAKRRRDRRRGAAHRFAAAADMAPVDGASRPPCPAPGTQPMADSRA